VRVCAYVTRVCVRVCVYKCAHVRAGKLVERLKLKYNHAKGLNLDRELWRKRKYGFHTLNKSSNKVVSVISIIL